MPVTAPVFDPFRRPINPLALKYDIARPSRSSARRVQSHFHPAQDSDPEELAYWMAQSETGEPLMLLEYLLEMPEKDQAYKSAIEQRVLFAANQPKNVRPASSDQVDVDVAKEFEDVLAQPGIANAWQRVLQALPLGFSVSWIEWVEKINSLTTKRRLWPKSLVLKPPTWFKFSPQDMREPYLRGEENELVPLTPGAYLVHLHEGMSTIPIRGGISRLNAWYFMFKKYSEKDLANFNENYLIPWMIGTLGPGQAADSAEGRIMAEAMEAIGHDMRALLTEGQRIEALEVQKPSTIGPYLSWFDYVDKSYARSCLGQLQSTDSTGLPHGAGKSVTAKETLLETIVASDARQLNETIRNFLAIPYTQHNVGRRPDYMRIDSDVESMGLPADAEKAMAIVEAVGERRLTRESGKSMLQIFLGLSGDQADSLLGKGSAAGAPPPPAASTAAPPPQPAAADPNAAPADAGLGQVPVTDPAGTLNGAQIQQARAIVADFNAGVITREQALEQLINFLNLERARAEKVLGALPTGAPSSAPPPGTPPSPPTPPALNSARSALRAAIDRVGLDRLVDRIARGWRDE